MAKEKIALLGGNGMLGTDIAALCEKNNVDVTVFDLPNWDITVEADIKKAIDSVISAPILSLMVKAQPLTKRQILQTL